ncbi:hypothetical protein F4561_004706 [Lipingzhangella halophila]|uniref:Uncharacterized protein n=2 Tax=Lipingzhangella halophila TaxID=1783352 RepID=A0A7W7W4K1_9ACTN|nr:hypothetical protein [Lipingzhangella halophila]MBB4933886.1 hypothetical protein [Lipingzhangella halophila]
MYRILYTDDGILCGAVAHSDAELIAACRDEIVRLHGGGTPLPEYFERYVAGLDPPNGE